MSTAALDNYYLYRKTSDTGRLSLSSPTAVHAAGVDSIISSLINIGFTFNFNNVNYTQFAVSTDGYVELGAASSNDYTNDLIQQGSRILLCPWWDDLRTRAGGTGVRYELQGSSGSRKLIIDFHCQIHWNSTEPQLKFQCVLYEGTNRIEFRYDDPNSSSTGNTSATCGVKIAIAGGTSPDGKFRDFIGSTTAPYSTENNAKGGWSEKMVDGGSTTKIPNNALNGNEGRDFPGDPDNAQQSQQYYFLFSPDAESSGGGDDDHGGGNGPGFGNDVGRKYSIEPGNGGRGGPVLKRFENINCNYGKKDGIEQVPFALQQPGPFSLKRRSTAYQVTRGDKK